MAKYQHQTLLYDKLSKESTAKDQNNDNLTCDQMYFTLREW
jgi:hypothetical protein